jgi:hypothetical protein
MITEQPDDWDFPLTNWFDNMLNHPRKAKRIIVKDESREIVYVSTPGGALIELPEGKARDYESLGLSIRRVE